MLASIQPNPGLPPSIELRVRLVSAWGEVWGEHERTVNLAYDACSGTRGGHAVIYPESPSQLSCGSQTCPGVNLTFALPEGIDGAKLCRGAQCTGFMRRGSLGPEGHLDGMSCDVEGPPARLFCRERPGRIPATEIYEVALYRGESLVAELGVPVTYDQLYPNEGGCDARPCRTATLDLGDVEVMR